MLQQEQSEVASGVSRSPSQAILQQFERDPGASHSRSCLQESSGQSQICT